MRNSHRAFSREQGQGAAGTKNPGGVLAEAQEGLIVARIMHLRHPLFAACALSIATLAQAADPAPGDSREQVLAKLGTPTGHISVGDLERLFFERGEVTLTRGSVTSVKLLTRRQWEQSERERLASAKEKAREAGRTQTARAESRRRGAEALTLLLDDARWKEADPQGRLEILARFAKSFPEADIAAVKAETERRRDLELAEKRRLKELELRVATAEANAREAQSRAEAAKAEAARAVAAAESARRQAAAAPRGMQVYSFAAGGLINGRPACDWHSHGGSSVTIGNDRVLIHAGSVPPGATPRPIVIAPNPPPPKR